MAFEEFVVGLFDDHVDVTGSGSTFPDIALSLEREVIAGGHPGRHLDLESFFAPDRAGTTAVPTGIGDHRAFAMAGRTGNYVHELPEQGPLYSTNLAYSIALITAAWLPATARTASVAGLAGNLLAQLDRALRPGGDFLEREFQLHLQIATPMAASSLSDRKSTRLNSSHTDISRMPSSA